MPKLGNPPHEGSGGGGVPKAAMEWDGGELMEVLPKRDKYILDISKECLCDFASAVY
jgi:hypothetical protein